MTRPICAACVEVEHGLQPVTHVRRGPAGKVKVTVLLCTACREGEELRKKRQPVSVSQAQPSRKPGHNFGRRKKVGL